MSKISEKLNIINNAKNDIKTSIENKGVSVGDIGIQEYAGKISEIKSAPVIEKGLVINAFDNDGYATDISVVGITKLLAYAFGSYGASYSNLLAKKLVNVNFPSDLTSIEQYAFQYCTNLALTELPGNLNTIGQYAFRGCTNLALTELPSGITTINSAIFRECTNLTEMTFYGNVTSFLGAVFYDCVNLSKFVLPNITSVPSLGNASIFTNTPIAKGMGYIYVPDDLVSSFQTASNWSTYASQIKGVSEL